MRKYNYEPGDLLVGGSAVILIVRKFTSQDGELIFRTNAYIRPARVLDWTKTELDRLLESEIWEHKPALLVQKEE